VAAIPVWTCFKSGRRSLGLPHRGLTNPASGSSYAPYSEIEVMSQCTRATSIPKVLIARAPTDPTIWSNSGATASNARPIRSSLSAAGSIPKTSATAHSLAQSTTLSSGRGLVRRFATSASITCPCVSRATSRTGQARSTIPATSSRRANSAPTGSAPNTFSTLGGPYANRDGRRPRGGRIRQPCHTPPTPHPNKRQAHPPGPTPRHVRRTGLAVDRHSALAVLAVGTMLMPLATGSLLSLNLGLLQAAETWSKEEATQIRGLSL
jgi:hypothetical protein